MMNPEVSREKYESLKSDYKDLEARHNEGGLIIRENLAEHQELQEKYEVLKEDYDALKIAFDAQEKKLRQDRDTICEAHQVIHEKDCLIDVIRAEKNKWKMLLAKEILSAE
jgi:hypothetical protein